MPIVPSPSVLTVSFPRSSLRISQVIRSPLRSSTTSVLIAASPGSARQRSRRTEKIAQRIRLAWRQNRSLRDSGRACRGDGASICLWQYSQSALMVVPSLAVWPPSWHRKQPADVDVADVVRVHAPGDLHGGKHVAAVQRLQRRRPPGRARGSRRRLPETRRTSAVPRRSPGAPLPASEYSPFRSRTPSRRTNGSVRLIRPAAIASSTARSAVGEIRCATTLWQSMQSIVRRSPPRELLGGRALGGVFPHLAACASVTLT